MSSTSSGQNGTIAVPVKTATAITSWTPGASHFDPQGRLIFREPEHRYFLDVEDAAHELISVTTAIKEGLKGVCGEEFWTEQSRLRGAAVHKAILYHAQGDLDADTLHPVVAPYFDGYLQFLAEERPTILYVEQLVFDEAYKYGGTFDLLVVLHGFHEATPMANVTVLDLIDVKSGAIPWWCDLQVCAYRRRVTLIYPRAAIRPWCLQLKNNGTFHLEPLAPTAREIRTSEHDFLSVLRTAQLQRRHARS